MKRSWILGGWLFALGASAIPSLWMASDLAQRNPLGIYVDDAGAYTPQLYWQFFKWWLPIAGAASLLALACMVLNRRAD
ncbi:MAG TPA: hypothetical protein VIC34_08035 [Croceibacterium sp.]